MPAPTYADAVQAFLFQCDDSGLYAVSLDATGRDIPRDVCGEGWHFRAAFALGVHEAIPASIPPEPVLRGIRARGYYIWREGVPYGTTQ